MTVEHDAGRVLVKYAHRGQALAQAGVGRIRAKHLDDERREPGSLLQAVARGAQDEVLADVPVGCGECEVEEAGRRDGRAARKFKREVRRGRADADNHGQGADRLGREADVQVIACGCRRDRCVAFVVSLRDLEVAGHGLDDDVARGAAGGDQRGRAIISNVQEQDVRDVVVADVHAKIRADVGLQRRGHCRVVVEAVGAREPHADGAVVRRQLGKVVLDAAQRDGGDGRERVRAGREDRVDGGREGAAVDAQFKARARRDRRIDACLRRRGEAQRDLVLQAGGVLVDAG